MTLEVLIDHKLLEMKQLGYLACTHGLGAVGKRGMVHLTTREWVTREFITAWSILGLQGSSIDSVTEDSSPSPQEQKI